MLRFQQTHKNLPAQFQRANTSLSANIVIASFGSSSGYHSLAFPLKIESDTTAPTASEKPLRYGKLPEIHHIFRADPKSPNIVIVLFFTAAALVTLPILLGSVCYTPCSIAHWLTSSTVALPRRQFQSPPEIALGRSNLTRPILR